VATALAAGDGGTTLALDTNNLYWVMDGAIYMAPLGGGPPLAIGPDATAIAVDATDVYFVSNDPPHFGTVNRVPIGGGTTTVLASGRPTSLTAVAVDQANVYWIEGGAVVGTSDIGAIAAMPKSGGRVTILASGLTDPQALAVDDSGVYFSAGNFIATEIVRIPNW
jgi:hypothetical protein